jgi:polyferredoxin
LRRRIVQFAAALLLNPFPANFLNGRIYRGALKGICVPALNCYSCPAASGACPIGSLQVALVGVRGFFTRAAEAAAALASLYVAGAILVVGAVAGRFPCGWICPFGLLQELIFARRKRSLKPGALRYAKYAGLAILVVILPLALPYPSSPNFCKYVCPAGTVEAGLPLVAHDAITGRRAFDVGWLFAWKVTLAAAILAGAVLISRFFCRTLCPLGAAWGLLNRISLVGIEVDNSACTRCGFCRTVCPVDIFIYENAGSAECVRCLNCLKCPYAAVKVVLKTGGRKRRNGSSPGAERADT